MSVNEKKNNPADHSGHRERMKKRFLEKGIDEMAEHEVIELLLYYAIPRKNTNEIAHKLLDTCGSISSLFDAPMNLLTEAGLTENSATLIKLIPEICRMYFDDKYYSKAKIINSSNLGEIIMNKFIGKNEENVVLMLLDAKSKELFCGIISRGNFNSAEVSVQKIVSIALKYNAVYAVIAHNHPSGMALPSNKDLLTTKNLKTALAMVNIRLIDHIIVADRDFVSLAEEELM